MAINSSLLYTSDLQKVNGINPLSGIRNSAVAVCTKTVNGQDSVAVYYSKNNNKVISTIGEYTELKDGEALFFVVATNTITNKNLESGFYSVINEAISSNIPKLVPFSAANTSTQGQPGMYFTRQDIDIDNKNITTTIKDCLASFIANMQLSAYNRIILTLQGYTAICLYHKSSTYIAYTNNLADAFEDDYNLNIFKNLSARNGFRYKLGYIQDGDILKDDKNYIAINYSNIDIIHDANLKISQLASDIMTLSNQRYEHIYQLRKNPAPYYNEVAGTSVSDSTGGGMGQVSSSISAAFDSSILPQLDYTANATQIQDSFLPQEEFIDWELVFIPAKNTVFDDDKHNLENRKLVIINNELGGEENTTYKLPLIKTKTIDIDIPELTSYLQSINQLSEMQSVDDKPPYKLDLKSKTGTEKTTISAYFNNDSNRGKYNFNYSVFNKNKKEYEPIATLNFCDYVKSLNDFSLNLTGQDHEHCQLDLSVIAEDIGQTFNLYELELFEAYTRGHDFIQEHYTTVRPQERDPLDLSETSRIMNFEDNYFTYKYSGRNIDLSKGTLVKDMLIGLIHSCDLLQEEDVTLGETYGEQKYFIEALKAPIWNDVDDYIKTSNGEYFYKDSFKVKDYLDLEQGGYDKTQYTEEDIEPLTAYIDLAKCEHYKPEDATYENNWCDCSYYSGLEISNRECLYQKLGYCPYRFTNEKHPRRIRTLQQSKSNRFNLIQETSKVFEVYPNFHIKHEKNGLIKLDKEGKPIKNVYFTKDQGEEKIPGFRYEKNLKNISRTVDSNQITTKLYVENVDSNFSNTGVCSIQTAKDNIGRNSYILDFSYYTKRGILDAEQVQRDLYGIDKDDFAFLPRIGSYNEQYDNYSNLIITMTGKTLSELEAQNTVSITGITTCLEERKKVSQRMYQYKTSSYTLNEEKITTTIKKSFTTSDTYKNYMIKYREQATLLWGLVEQLFFSGNYFSFPELLINKTTKEKYYKFHIIDAKGSGDQFNNIQDGEKYGEVFEDFKNNNYCNGELFWRLLLEGLEDYDYTPPFNKWEDFKEKIVDTKIYEVNGTLGKYKSLYNEVKYWKTERAKILNKINDLYTQFYKKYEAFIKEGTFTNQNYLTENEYYWAGVDVLSDSSEPKLTYNFSPIDISIFPENEIYDVNLGDITYVEDIDFFGINKHTGLPNKEKVLIDSINYDLDNPSNISIGVKNYASRFDSLFQSINASVQSLTYNENVYKRASNFTAKQYIKTESLQDTLDIGDLTLLDTDRSNIVLDESGTEGNDINNTASQFKQTGEGILFSTDGGETWDVGVGPKGINMDYAKFGNLDASKVQIVDGEYLYFLWDKDGINAYRDPSKSADGLKDFARFNKYGLSLIEKGNTRLRVGYEFKTDENSNTTGDYQQELPLKDQNIGFYLYNDKGQPIFKTETRSSYNEDDKSDYSARLSLTGEIFATNKVLDGSPSASTNSTISLVKLSQQYFFGEQSGINFEDFKEINQENMKKIINNDGPYMIINDNITTSHNIAFNKNEITGEEESVIYDYSPSSDVIIYDRITSIPSSEDIDNTLIKINKYVIKIHISSDIDYSSVAIDFKEILSLIMNRATSLDDAKELTPFKDDMSSSLNLQYDKNTISKQVVIRASKPATTTTDDSPYSENDIGKVIGKGSSTLTLITKKTTDSIIVPNKLVSEASMKYIGSTAGGETVQNNFFTYITASGITYWAIKEGYDGKINSGSSDFSTSELGVFINNKKILSDEDRDVDRTNVMSQTITKDLSTEEYSERLQAFLSGAERTFSITAAGNKDGEKVYNNILSVLKNGVLYIGGSVSDYYGNKLNISGLQYLPDEIRVTNPSILMSNTGQIWCDWSKFYCAFENEDGTMSYTAYSLMDFLNEIKNWSSSVGTGSMSANGISVAGLYIDEQDIQNQYN